MEDDKDALALDGNPTETTAMKKLSAKEALQFVNSHAPITGQIHTDEHGTKRLFIYSEEVDRAGHVIGTSDIIQSDSDGRFSLTSIRDVLGY